MLGNLYPETAPWLPFQAPAASAAGRALPPLPPWRNAEEGPRKLPKGQGLGEGGQAGSILYYILYTIYYILYTIYYILYTIYYILYTIYYILYTIYYILYTIYYILYYILYTIYYILYTIYYILYTIYYILYTIYYILYTIYYILYYTIHGVCISFVWGLWKVATGGPGISGSIAETLKSSVNGSTGALFIEVSTLRDCCSRAFAEFEFM